MKNAPNIRSLDINATDTLYFDWKNAILVNNKLSVPIFLKTDDRINSVDFSFKFNETILEVDTVIKNDSNIEMAYFFNPNDRKLRLTSYSLKAYNLDDKIMTVTFKILTSSAANTDIFELAGFLNGDLCTSFFSSNIFNVTSSSQSELEKSLKIYPNPVCDVIHILSENEYDIKIYNNNGSEIKSISTLAKSSTIDLSDIEKGHLVLKLWNRHNGQIIMKRIIKN